MSLFYKNNIRRNPLRILLAAASCAVISLSDVGGNFGISASAKDMSAAKKCEPSVLNTPIFWDAERLANVKTKLDAGDAALMPAYEALIKRAENALSVTPYTVTDKTRPGPSGDLQDYVSLSRYFWVWFGDYAAWLIRSDFGQKAKKKYNNHGTFYDAQLSHTLVFAGRCDLAKKALKSGYQRTQKQITKEGLMPGEIERTKSLFYHAFNAEAFLRMAHLAQKLGAAITEALDRLEYENPQSYLNLLGAE